MISVKTLKSSTNYFNLYMQVFFFLKKKNPGKTLQVKSHFFFLLLTNFKILFFNLSTVNMNKSALEFARGNGTKKDCQIHAFI